MTMYELNFSLLVEQMLSKIVEPAYRQIMVEVRAPPPPPDQGLTLLDYPHTGRSWWRFVHPLPTRPGLDPAGFPTYRQIMVEVHAPPSPTRPGLDPAGLPTYRQIMVEVHAHPSPTRPGLDPAGFPTYRQIMVEVRAPPPPPDQGLTLLDSPHTGRSWWRFMHPPLPHQTRA